MRSFLLHRMSPEVAHSDALRQRSTSVAFGAKPTWTEGESRLIRSKMTHHRHWLCTAAMVLIPGFSPIKVLV